jgi:SNF2 family DNA or RNA helicase
MDNSMNMKAEILPRDQFSFFIRFQYDMALIELVRSIPGCSWDKKSKCWIGRYIFYDMVTGALLKKGVEIIERPQANQALKAFHAFQGELENTKKLDGNDCFMLTKIKLDPHQCVGSAFLAIGERVLLADAVGLQKTATAINACLILKNLRDVKKVLYVTLNTLKFQVQEEIHKFTDERALVIDGSKDERAATFEQWEAGNTMFLIVNYEAIHSYFELFGRARPEIIIADEVSRAKNWQSKTSKALRKIPSRYFWAMGATPLENNFDEVFSILKIVNPELLGNRTNFINFYAKIGFFGEIKGWHTDRIKDFANRIQPYMLQRTNEDIGRTLPNTNVLHHWMELSQDQRRVYEDLKVKSKQTITVGDTTYSQMISVLVKLREACDFADLGDANASGASTKLEELMRIIKESKHDDKIIVFTQWLQAANRISDRLTRDKISHVLISGKVKGAERHDTLNHFKKMPSLKVLVTTDCLAWGINLQECNKMVIFDLLYTPSKMTQRVGRIRRYGQKREMTVHTLLCKNTVEEKMLDILSRKQGYSEMLFDPMAKNVKLSASDLKKIILSA